MVFCPPLAPPSPPVSTEPRPPPTPPGIVYEPKEEDPPVPPAAPRVPLLDAPVPADPPAPTVIVTELPGVTEIFVAEKLPPAPPPPPPPPDEEPFQLPAPPPPPPPSMSRLRIVDIPVIFQSQVPTDVKIASLYPSTADADIVGEHAGLLACEYGTGERKVAMAARVMMSRRRRIS